jgi:hypothetical protein
MQTNSDKLNLFIKHRELLVGKCINDNICAQADNKSSNENLFKRMQIHFLSGTIIDQILVIFKLNFKSSISLK